MSKQLLHMSPRLRTVWQLIVDFIDITERRHIFLLASGIAFNQLLCLIPFVLVAISVVGGMLDETSTKESVRQALSSVMPDGIEATETISHVIYELSAVFSYSTIAGWIAGFILLWTSSALYSSMRTGLNAIFHIETPKIFIIYKLKDMAFTIITVVLIVITTFISPAYTLVEDFGAWLLPDRTESFILGIGARLTSLTSTLVLFFFLYMFVPNRRLPWPIVIMSTLISVGLWEAARALFTWYVSASVAISKFYGGYIALASLALWAYYSSLIFLFGAELAQFIHLRRTEHRSPDA
ncbi:MAG: YihY/virulence factor BrkB family protein [Candidatus Kapabacteria bacterium]|nr:YihY/virulence factor BrkB family protein [Candidatus Kapabacteria bacterium]